MTNRHQKPPLPAVRLCRNRRIVYDCYSESRLSGMKNLMNSTESTIKILRLSLQNDVATQSLKGEDVIEEISNIFG